MVEKMRKGVGVIKKAREVLKIEAQGILGLIEKIGPEFEHAVDMILRTKGRVILTGIGKSGIVAKKITANRLEMTDIPKRL